MPVLKGQRRRCGTGRPRAAGGAPHRRHRDGVGGVRGPRGTASPARPEPPARFPPSPCPRVPPCPRCPLRPRCVSPDPGSLLVLFVPAPHASPPRRRAPRVPHPAAVPVSPACRVSATSRVPAVPRLPGAPPRLLRLCSPCSPGIPVPAGVPPFAVFPLRRPCTSRCPPRTPLSLRAPHHAPQCSGAPHDPCTLPTAPVSLCSPVFLRPRCPPSPRCGPRAQHCTARRSPPTLSRGAPGLAAANFPGSQLVQPPLPPWGSGEPGRGYPRGCGTHRARTHTHTPCKLHPQAPSAACSTPLTRGTWGARALRTHTLRL